MRDLYGFYSIIRMNSANRKNSLESIQSFVFGNDEDYQCDDLAEENKELRRTIADLYSQLIPNTRSDTTLSLQDDNEHQSVLARMQANISTLESSLMMESKQRKAAEAKLVELHQSLRHLEVIHKDKCQLLTDMQHLVQ